jgi:drug/metabolite transporter (DMT)-like permease
VILVAVAIQRPPLGVAARVLPLLALIGLADTCGNVLFAAASQSGLVSVTSVLASLYPIVTVVLARVLLAERVARSQEGGIGLTLAGVVLISAG